MIRCVLEPAADTEDMRGRLLQYAYDEKIDTEPLHFARGISCSGMLAHRTEESLVAEILQAGLVPVEVSLRRVVAEEVPTDKFRILKFGKEILIINDDETVDHFDWPAKDKRSSEKTEEDSDCDWTSLAKRKTGGAKAAPKPNAKKSKAKPVPRRETLDWLEQELSALHSEWDKSLAAEGPVVMPPLSESESESSDDAAGPSAGVDAAGAEVKDAAGADAKGLGPSAGVDGAGSSSDDMLEIRRKHALDLLDRCTLVDEACRMLNLKQLPGWWFACLEDNCAIGRVYVTFQGTNLVAVCNTHGHACKAFVPIVEGFGMASLRIAESWLVQWLAAGKARERDEHQALLGSLRSRVKEWKEGSWAPPKE